MKRLKNKEITDKVLEIVKHSIFGILVTVYIAAIVGIICCYNWFYYLLYFGRY